MMAGLILELVNEQNTDQEKCCNVCYESFHARIFLLSTLLVSMLECSSTALSLLRIPCTNKCAPKIRMCGTVVLSLLSHHIQLRITQRLRLALAAFEPGVEINLWSRCQVLSISS